MSNYKCIKLVWPRVSLGSLEFSCDNPLNGVASQKHQTGFNQGRIAKPLRGGGGRENQPQSQAGTPAYQAIAAGSPLARIKEDENGAGKRRAYRHRFYREHLARTDVGRILVLLE